MCRPLGALSTISAIIVLLSALSPAELRVQMCPAHTLLATVADMSLQHGP